MPLSFMCHLSQLSSLSGGLSYFSYSAGIFLGDLWKINSLWKSRLIWLLHPQHQDGIFTGLTLYRVPLDHLSEYPEPWS